MRRPILKSSNKTLKGNISLLVILILLASSVIGLLSINQIQRLLTYGNMTFNYFRAYYLAKAGTELGLTEVHYREDGFNHKIENTKDDNGAIDYNPIIQNNFLGDAGEDGETKKYEAFNPYFEMTISGSFANLTNDVRFSSDCISGNKIVLNSGAGIMVSLFSDNTQDLEDMFTGTTDKNLTQLKNITDLKMEGLEPSGSNFTFGLFSYDKDGNMDSIVVRTGNDLSKFLNTNHNDDSNIKKYLTIKNSGNEEVKFCISMNGSLIPSSDSLITVRGNYGDMEVGLQSIVKKGVPDWTLNVLGEGGPG